MGFLTTTNYISCSSLNSFRSSFPLMRSMLMLASSFTFFSSIGSNMCVLPFFFNVYVFFLPSGMKLLSNCHGLPKKICHTSMGITSHIIFFLYPPILNSTKHCLVTITWCPFYNHETLYGFGCVIVSSSNFSTISVDTKLSVLPLSIITFHTLSLVLQVVLKRLFLCTCLSTSTSGFKRTFLNIKDLPSFAPSISTFIFCAS